MSIKSKEGEGFNLHSYEVTLQSTKNPSPPFVSPFFNLSIRLLLSLLSQRTRYPQFSKFPATFFVGPPGCTARIHAQMTQDGSLCDTIKIKLRGVRLSELVQEFGDQFTTRRHEMVNSKLFREAPVTGQVVGISGGIHPLLYRSTCTCKFSACIYASMCTPFLPSL